jgi:putative Ca2+/H+ antiporter (TMEM165/GDT1 family)
MGDKTQIATLLMSAESQSPGLVFAGAAAALIATSLLGVLLGRALATKFSPKTLDTAAGVCLLCVSAMLCWDVVHFLKLFRSQADSGNAYSEACFHWCSCINY